jgi:integrase/recombinase XerD
MTSAMDQRKLTEQLLARGLAPRSVKLYVRTILAAEAWCQQHGTDLRRVSPSLVAQYAGTKPYTHSSQNVLRVSLDHYWRITKRRQPPTWAIRVPKEKRPRCRAIDPAPAAQLTDAALERRDRKGLAVLVGLYLGLRRFEIAKLRWQDFRDDFAWLVVVGKGDVTAELPVHPVLRERLLEAATGAVGDYVFPGRFRTGVTPATVWAWCLEVADDAGVGHVAPHVLRHTCLATANDETGDLRATQEFARHARPDTTARYTRVTNKRLTMVMASLDYRRIADDECAHDGPHGANHRLPA